MKHLNTSELLSRAKTLASDERRATVALIEHLEEIQRRRLYAELGFSSLWEFATKWLGLSEGSAQRRIQAMRLVHDEPSAKVALESGELSLSNAAKLQNFRQNEKKNGRKTNASELVDKVKSMSQRECEKALFDLAPESLPQDRDRTVSSKDDRELKFVVSAEVFAQLQELKGLLGHAKPNATYAELLQYMLVESLPRLKKKKGILVGQVKSGKTGVANDQREKRSKTLQTRGAKSSLPQIHEKTDPVSAEKPVTKKDNELSAHVPSFFLSELAYVEGKKALFNAAPTSTAAAIVNELPQGKRVYLPALLRKPVWNRSQGRCEIIASGRRCESRYQLEIDHIQPLALNGSNDFSNLRLICRHHNQQQAQAKLGILFVREHFKAKSL